jgi:hypothetical protein
VEALVLSGALILVLSGAPLSCYQAQQLAAKPYAARLAAFPNWSSNLTSINLTIRSYRVLWINRHPTKHPHKHPFFKSDLGRHSLEHQAQGGAA